MNENILCPPLALSRWKGLAEAGGGIILQSSPNPLRRETKYLVLIFLLNSFFAFGQSFKIDNSIPVTAYGRSLQMPWAGGINFPQWSEIDLNQDGNMDLFMIDRANNRVLTLINNGSGGTQSFHYAPEYAKIFPQLNGWAFLYDYNCDGLHDLFTVSSSCNCGIIKYKASYNTTTGMKFTLVDSLMESFVPGGQKYNIPVSGYVTPNLNDIDGDGDMDILVQASLCVGGYSYYRNMSKEHYGVCDSLGDYMLETNSWGEFVLASGTFTYVKAGACGINCPPIAHEPGRSKISNYEPQWNQSDAAKKDDTYSLPFTLDLDNDGDKELLVGDSQCINLLRLKNIGTPTHAVMECSTEDTLFPSYNVSSSIRSFANCGYIDADDDGVKDLLVGNSEFENYKGVHYYKNTGTNSAPVFSFKNDSLFQSEMIEVGEGAAPVFFDVDNDGLKDIIIGNAFRTIGTSKISGLSFYKNIGTSSTPAFQFITNDFAGISALNLQGPLFPAFGDLDGDGDKDMLIGVANGELRFFNNMSGTFQFTTARYMRIDAGSNATPQLYDLDGDTKLDLIVGQKEGGLIRYYRNTGGTTAYFDSIPTNDTLGQIVQRNPFYSDSYTVPFMYRDSGVTKLIVADMQGNIIRYNNIDGNPLSGAYSIKDTLFHEDFGHLYGFNQTVSGGDINNDGLIDLAIGLYSGGMQIYMQGLFNNIPVNQSPYFSFNIYPNPANELITVKAFHFTSQYSVKFYNTIGQSVFSQTSSSPTLQINTSDFAEGVYLVQLTVNGISSATKLIISHP